jgi:hypothetical protein
VNTRPEPKLSPAREGQISGRENPDPGSEASGTPRPSILQDSSAKPSADDPFLLRFAKTVPNSRETLGILVHGSFATGTYAPGSDIDLVCVTKSGDFGRIVCLIEGFDVDVASGSHESIEKKIRYKSSTNNNSILYAFLRGRPLIDRDGSIAGLRYEARRIWLQGPTAPTNEELARVEAAARSASAEADRLRIRATRSTAWREIAHLRSSTLFVDCFYGYCRIRGLWASAIWETLKWADPRYEYLQTVTSAYLSAPSLNNRLQAIQHLAQAISTSVAASRVQSPR